MERYKSCCGLSAVLVEPLFPMIRDVKKGNGQLLKNVKFYTAIYECKTCHSLSLRGESSLREWNTFIEWITPDRAKALVAERIKYEVDIRSHEEVSPA
jgi:hypothetical protein